MMLRSTRNAAIICVVVMATMTSMLYVVLKAVVQSPQELVQFHEDSDFCMRGLNAWEHWPTQNCRVLVGKPTQKPTPNPSKT